MKRYPFPALRPEHLLTFVEMEGFIKDWHDLGLTDEDLFDLQISIMLRPEGWPVIQGTDGLRKMRFAPRRWGRENAGQSECVTSIFPISASFCWLWPSPRIKRRTSRRPTRRPFER